MNSSLVASFVRRPAVSAEYWLHIEQVLPEENTASLGDVADIIDAMFDTSPCSGPDGAEPEDDPAPEPVPVTVDEFAELVRKSFPQLAVCGVNANGDYAAQLKVAISHPGEQYTLRLTGGVIDKTTVVEEKFRQIITVKNAVSYQLEYPVTSAPSFAWRGSVTGPNGNMTGPDIVLDGGSISWQGIVTGSLLVEYDTRYDLVDLVVFGDNNGDPGECRAVCFFHGLVDELDIRQPDIDPDATETERQLYCDAGGRVVIGGDDSDVTCYEVVTYTYHCQCSGVKLYQIDEEVEVPCPDGIRCQGGASECRSFMGDRIVLGDYIDCGEGDGQLSSSEYYRRICCEDPAGSLPTCSQQLRKNPGGVQIDPAIEEAYLAGYGNKLRMMPVSPADGDCGVTRTIIGVAARNCCDEVDPLVIDTSRSATILADNSHGIVYLTAPSTRSVTVIVNGNGFYADDDLYHKSAIYEGGSGFLIHTANACGACRITITDGCSVTHHAVASTNGKWGSMVGDWALGHEIAITGLVGTVYSDESGIVRMVGQNAAFKQWETFGRTIACSASACLQYCADICGSKDDCPMSAIGTHVYWPCYRLDSVFSNRSFWYKDATGCITGVRTCSCTCVSGNSYQQWIC